VNFFFFFFFNFRTFGGHYGMHHQWKRAGAKKCVNMVELYSGSLDRKNPARAQWSNWSRGNILKSLCNKLSTGEQGFLNKKLLL
jgi:hypothetical protein